VQKPQLQPPNRVAPVEPSTPVAKPEQDSPSDEIPKVVYPPPKPTETESEKPPPFSSGEVGRRSPSKQAIAFLAVLVVSGLVCLAIRLSQPPSPLPSPIAVATPSPTVMATPTVEQKARPTPEFRDRAGMLGLVAVQPSPKATAPDAGVTLNPEVTASPSATDRRVLVTQGSAPIDTPTKGELARRALDNATKDHPWVNSLGMKFVPVAGTQVLFSVWDTRVQDFETFVKSTGYDATAGMYSLDKHELSGWGQRGATWKEPGFSQGPTHPVVGVSWNDAKEFCKWLTK
jgi:formylglycine-generating enzyme required for sulfatase activity